jgi:hypothetical protein
VPSDIELDKLHAAIADNGEELQKIKANRLLSAGQKLLRERACKHERRKLDLRVKLFQEGLQIKRLEGTCEFYRTPVGKAAIKGGRISSEKHHQRRLLTWGSAAGHPPRTDSAKKTFSLLPLIRRRLHL